MINKKYTIQLIKNFSVEDVESCLIYTFLTINGINYVHSQIITSYFSERVINKQLVDKIKDIKIDSIKILENYLELLMPDNDRKLNGAFFTPSYIVNYIIDEIAPEKDHKTIDPSSGCGAFLIGLAEYYNSKFGKSVKQTVRENIYGADILPYNIERAKLLLTIFALQKGEVLEDDDFNLYKIDSLKHKWTIKFDNVIGNPPYVKFQDLSQETREFLMNKWKTISGGAFNLYFAFFELGYNILNPTGKLGYITPNNYFTSLAGESLRSFFLDKKCVEKIIDFNSHKVFDVQTYTAITFLKKEVTDRILYDRINHNHTPELFLNSINTSANLLSSLDAKKWRLLKSDERKNIENIETAGTPIKQMFDICVGIATLKDDIYFVDGAMQNDNYIEKTGYDGKKYKIEIEATRRVFKISDFKNQSDLEQNKRRIIFPYTINGSATIIPENEFKEKYPYCYEYLLSVKAELLSRDKGKVKYDPFYAWGRTQGLTKFGKKILNPTFSQKPRFLLVDDENALFTNGYGIFFKPQINQKQLFNEHSNALCDSANIDIVQKILNSEIMHYYISKTSVAIDGGYPCYQKNFIEKFSIPNFSASEINELRRLSDSDKINQLLASKYQINLPSPNLSL